MSTSDRCNDCKQETYGREATFQSSRKAAPISGPEPNPERDELPPAKAQLTQGFASSADPFFRQVVLSRDVAASVVNRQLLARPPAGHRLLELALGELLGNGVTGFTRPTFGARCRGCCLPLPRPAPALLSRAIALSFEPLIETSSKDPRSSGSNTCAK